jgi:hypothetical protein
MASVVIAGDTSGTVTLAAPATAGTTTLTLPTTNGTVVVTGTTPTLNGITFPATQVPSADANTLDDYEEGTWTPVYTTSGGGESVTYDIQSAKYTKIGNCVYFQFIIRTDVFSGGSGNVRVSLPFAPSGLQVTAYTGEASNWTTNCPTFGYIGGGSAEMALQRISGGNSTNITTSNITNSANSNLLNGGGFYYTA